MLINQQEYLANHPDRIKWNEKYSKVSAQEYLPHPILQNIEEIQPLPPSPILELACGLSGNVLSLASLGHNVLAADISDVALNLLSNIAKQKQLEPLITFLPVDLNNWQIPKETFSLVLALKYWDKKCFLNACNSVIKGGLIAWETFNKQHLCYHPAFHSKWCLEDKEPANLLPSDFEILVEQDFNNGSSFTRRLIARRF